MRPQINHAQAIRCQCGSLSVKGEKLIRLSRIDADIIAEIIAENKYPEKIIEKYLLYPLDSEI